MNFIMPHPDGAVLVIRVTPRAAKNSMCKTADRLRIRLQAPPVDNKANRALVDFLSDELNLPRGRFRLLTGQNSRNKNVLVHNVTPTGLASLISEILRQK